MQQYESNKKNITLFIFGLIAIAIMVFLLGVAIPSIYQNPTSDNYFQLAHARVLKEYGFVTTDVLRMHDGLNFIIPQWLFALLFTFLYQTFGILGYKMLGIFLFLSFIGTLFFIYKKFTWRQWKPLFLIAITSMICILMFNGVRPYWISTSILILEAYLLTQLRNQNISPQKSYVVLGILSILCINIHNSLWIGMFLVWLTFFAETILEKVRKTEPKLSFKKELICLLIIVIGGFINPYGLKGIIYIFTSVQSIRPFHTIIGELRPIWQWNNYFVVGYLLIVVIWSICRFKKMTWHGRFLMLGFGIMGIMHLRNIFLFLAGASYGILESYINDSDDGKTSFRIALTVFYLSIFVPITSFLSMDQPFPNESSGYLAVDQIPMTNTEKRENTTVFSYTTNMGSYLTWKGYKPYMDGCAELYGEENNGKKDYLTEFKEAFKSKEEFKKFVKDYMFDYILFGEDISDTLRPLGYELVGHTKDEMKRSVGPKTECFIFKKQELKR